MSGNNEADDFLFGSAVPSAKFPTIGTTVTGVITEPPAVAEQRDLQGNVKTFDDGTPQKMLVVTLQTAERDPEIDDDEGLRKLYVKGSKKPESKSMTAALGQAVRNAKANGLEVGGTVTVTYISDGPQEQRGFNPPKQYTATYTPPSVQASGDYLGASEPAAAQETLPTTPATTPAAPAAAAETPTDQAKKLIAAGVDDATIAGVTGLDTGVIAAMRNPAPAAENPAEKAKKMIAAGVDDATIVQVTGLDANIVAALHLT